MKISHAVLVAVASMPLVLADAVVPKAADGRALNLGFESGDLRDWQASGAAFDQLPIRGDVVAKRRADMKSNHEGEFWIGGFERTGDDPKGTLTSVPFKVTHPWASFLVAGGPWPETRVELVDSATGQTFFKISGHESETLRPVVVELKGLLGKQILIRLVDDRSGHWGHVNFDNFRFHSERPVLPNELTLKETAKNTPPPADQVLFAGLSAADAAAKA
ncbi:MAG: dehydrogenase, partial [Verrucomicrobiota bacterium]